MMHRQSAAVPTRNLMEHRGFYSRVRYSHPDRAFVGRVLAVRDAIEFKGDSVSRLRAAFHKALDDRLAEAERTGESLLKSRSGRLRVRLTPALHARATGAAAAASKSLNEWAKQLITEAA